MTAFGMLRIGCVYGEVMYGSWKRSVYSSIARSAGGMCWSAAFFLLSGLLVELNWFWGINSTGILCEKLAPLAATLS